MNVFISLLLVLFVSLPVWAEPLPEVTVPTQWQQCTADSDCDIVRDACRSCGTPIALHKDFIDDYLKADYRQREAAGILRSCEACSQQNVHVRCDAGVCVASRQ